MTIFVWYLLNFKMFLCTLYNNCHNSQQSTVALQHFPYAIHTAWMLLVSTEVGEVNCNQRMGAPAFLQVTHLNSKFAQSWLILIFFSPINHFLGPSDPTELQTANCSKTPIDSLCCMKCMSLYEMYVFTTSQLCKSSLNLKIWKVAQIKHEVCGI